MSSLSKIVSTFQKHGYLSQHSISQNAFYSAMDNIYGAQFDRQVALELWEQTSQNSRGEVMIQQLCQVIHQAQGILRTKIAELQRQTNELQLQLRQVQADQYIPPQQKRSQTQGLIDQLNNIKADLDEYNQDLRMVTEPFDVPFGGATTYVPNRYTQKTAGNDRAYTGVGASQIMQQSKGQGLTMPNEELKYVLWITLVIGFFELMMVYIKFDFLNLMVVVAILSIFMLNFFDSTYMKVCIGLTTLSIGLDVVWLALYASNYWNPPQVGEHSINQVGYLRFIVFFTVVLLILKIPLLALLIKNREVAADMKYVIPVFGQTKVTLSANASNLISKGFGRKSNIYN